MTKVRIEFGRALALGACSLLLLLSAGAVQAAPSLELGAPACTERTVRLEANAESLFDAEIRLALQSGLAATLSFEWRLWRKRDSWWDDRIANGGIRFRIFYDLLEERYEAFDEGGQSVAEGGDLREIEAQLCAGQDLEIRSPVPLLAKNHYYVDVLARLRPIDPSEIEGLEDWLRGSGKAAMRGISRGARKIFGDDAGLSSRTAIARSARFSGALP